MNLELSVTAFDDEIAAAGALKVINELSKSGLLKLYDAAVVSRNGEGKTKIWDNQDLTSSEGILFGAISGGVIGLLGGPAGVLVGAVAGGATGGATAAVVDLGFPRKDLHELAELLPTDSSALVLFYEDDLLDGNSNYETAKATLKHDISSMFITTNADVKNHWDTLVTNGKQTLEKITATVQAQAVKTEAELNTLKAKAANAKSEVKSNNEAELEKLSSRLSNQWAALEEAFTVQLTNFKSYIARLRARLANATGDTKIKTEAKLAEVEANYKDLREKFRNNAQTSLHGLNSQVETLQTRAATLKGEAQVKANLLTLELKTRQEAAEVKLHELKTSSDAAMGDVERGWSKAWHDLSQSYQEATREFNNY